MKSSVLHVSCEKQPPGFASLGNQDLVLRLLVRLVPTGLSLITIYSRPAPERLPLFRQRRVRVDVGVLK